MEKLKDINWRIAEDLKVSKVNLRDLEEGHKVLAALRAEVSAKKTTLELRAGKGRMVDAEVGLRSCLEAEDLECRPRIWSSAPM